MEEEQVLASVMTFGENPYIINLHFGLVEHGAKENTVPAFLGCSQQVKTCLAPPMKLLATRIPVPGHLLAALEPLHESLTEGLDDVGY